MGLMYFFHMFRQGPFDIQGGLGFWVRAEQFFRTNLGQDYFFGSPFRSDYSFRIQKLHVNI